MFSSVLFPFSLPLLLLTGSLLYSLVPNILKLSFGCLKFPISTLQMDSFPRKGSGLIGGEIEILR